MQFPRTIIVTEPLLQENDVIGFNVACHKALCNVYNFSIKAKQETFNVRLTVSMTFSDFLCRRIPAHGIRSQASLLSTIEKKLMRC